MLPLYGQVREVTFDSAKDVAETRLKVDEFSPKLPTDWSGYEALVMEVRASSPQRIVFRIFSGPGEEKSSRVMLQFYPGAWVRASIPVAMLSAAPSTGNDMAAVGNRSRPGYYLGLWGPFVPLRAVTAVSFTMEQPIGSPRIEIRSLRVEKKASSDAVLEPLPLVDEFGQWIHADWPGKATSLEALKHAWTQEADSLQPGAFGYCPYGGFRNTKTKATGFFRVDEVDGKWWFVDPDGHLFLSVGSDVIGPEMITRTTGREKFFRELPPRSLGVREMPRTSDPGASFFSWNLARRFGENWRSAWVDFTLRRMDAWGLNTVANWSDPALWRAQKKPYVIPLGRWETQASYLGLPDVYSEEFKKNVDAAAKAQCEPRQKDPWLLGYFLANEPPFPQKELQTADLILAGPDTATKQALKKWLAAGDTPERRKKFIEDAFDRYIQVTSAAVKKYDPNHLNLGMRSGGRPTEAEIRVSRAFDVYSVNVYDYELSAKRMRQITELTGKPVIIGEFHFGVPGRGLAASLVQVKDQAQRGAAYRYYVEQAFAMPGLIGTHWFQWADQPSTGRFDGENYNIGLVDVTDRPYEEMIGALKTTHARLQEVHAGKQQPFATKAQVH
ncbi:MAG TPA: hypothetical protein VHA11_09620 [Bryobacteraceae bacterium]|nr:hypothetical protein [Bryobacteraceae bacterium]